MTTSPPLIDDHAHPFPLQPNTLDLASLTLSADESAADRRRQAAPHRLMLELLRVRLAELLGCAPDDVVEARKDAAQEWQPYLRRLFGDAGFAGMLLDGAWAGPPTVDVGDYSKAAGTPMWSLLRLEPLIDSMLERGVDGASIAGALAEFVESGASAGAAGLKTVLAYRTGLAVDPAVSADEAYRSAESEPTVPVRRRAKPLRDYLLRQTFAQCADLGLPIQIHTGFGDSEIRLASANPVLLDDVLRTPEGVAAKVVLIHAGYPWHEELGYLTLVRENLWADYSLVNLFSPATTADRILRLIDLAPVDRILFGTDGHGSPETHWFAAKVLREAWAEVESRLAGAARESWLSHAAHRMFHDNAVELYRL